MKSIADSKSVLVLEKISVEKLYLKDCRMQYIELKVLIKYHFIII